MKQFIILLMLMPLLAFSQKKQIRVCVPSRTTIINCCCDSAKSVVPISSPRQNCCDSTLLKSLIDKIGPHKEEGWWEKWLPVLIALIPAIVTIIGFGRAFRQMYADNTSKAKFDWMKEFKAAAGKLLSNFYKIKDSYDEIYEIENKKNISKHILAAEKLEKQLQKDFTKKYQGNTGLPEFQEAKSKLDTAIQDLKALKATLNEKIDEMEDINSNDIFYTEQQASFKKLVFEMYDALNAVLVSLNPTKYASHAGLEQKISDFLFDKNGSSDGDIVGFTENIRKDIQLIMAEQSEEASGGKKIHWFWQKRGKQQKET